MPTAPSDPHRDVLKHAKLRVTQVRLDILAALGEHPKPITAQQLFDHLCAAAGKRRKPKPDRVTVYRTLNTLVDAALAHKVDPGDRVFRFSLTDHAHCHGEHHVHEHPHFVCDDCGTVECLEGAEVSIKRASPASDDTKRTLKQQDVVLHGTCGKCSDHQ